MVDYIERDSLGRAVAYQTVMSSLASLVATSGMVKLETVYSSVFIFTLTGGVTIICSVFLAFTLKDVYLLRLKSVSKRVKKSTK